MNNRPTLNYKALLDFSNRYEKLLDRACDMKKESKQLKRTECQSIVSKFLNLYNELRGPQRDYFQNKLQWWVEKLAGLATGVDPTTDVIDTINAEIDDAIKKVHTLLDILKLIINLRKCADMAQDRKQRQNKASLLCLTLHSMACYLISSYATEFTPLVEELIAQETKIRQDIIDDHKINKGRKVGEMCAELELVIGTLALLNVPLYVNLAGKALLPYYVLPTEAHQKSFKAVSLDKQLDCGLPIVYQPVCIRYVYITEYFKIAKAVNFDVFVKDAVLEKKADDGARNNVEPDGLHYEIIVAEEPFDLKKLSVDLTGLQTKSSFAYLLTSQDVYYVDLKSKPINFEKMAVPADKLEQLHQRYCIGDAQSTDKKALRVDNLLLSDVDYFEKHQNDKKVTAAVPTSTLDNELTSQVPIPERASVRVSASSLLAFPSRPSSPKTMPEETDSDEEQVNEVSNAAALKF